MQPVALHYQKNNTVNSGLFTAMFTESANDLMFEIDTKIIFVAQSFLYRPEKRFIAIHTFSAPAAHQVMVMPFF
jgi:hypothetical protein